MDEKKGLFAKDQFLKKIADSERIKRGWSQEKLWKMLEMKQTAIQPYITGTRIPKDSNLYKKIFLQAAKEQIKAEFWEELLSSKEFSFDELLEMVGAKKNLTAEELKAVRKFIEFTGWEK